MQQRHEQIPLADRIADLEARGVTDRVQQADAIGVSRSTLMRHLKVAGLTEERANLKKWIPWTVAQQHHSDPTLRKLRILAQAAQGRQTKHRLRRGQTVIWATKLVEEGLDVTYSRRAGVSIVPAGQPWILKRLLVAAQRAIHDMPQFDLGKDAN